MMRIGSSTAAALLLITLFFPALAAGSGGEEGQKQRFARGHVVVRFRQDLSRQEEGRVRALVSGRAGRNLPRTRIEMIELPPGWDEERAARLLSRHPSIEFAEPDWVVEPLSAMPTLTPGDASLGQQWYLDSAPFTAWFATSSNTIDVDVDIDAPEGWFVMAAAFDTTVTAAVGVIDSGCGELGVFDTTTGYDPKHIDLPNGVLFANDAELPADEADTTGDVNLLADDANGWDFDFTDNIPADDDPSSVATYHGTLISGIVAGAWDNTVGMAGVGAGRLKLLPLKALTFFNIVAAVEYAMDLVDDGHPVRVLNMSFKTDNGRDYEPLREAVKLAQASGIAVVAAAGNGAGGNNDDFLGRVFPAEYTRDPAISNVLAVAATGTSGSLAAFSNFGPASVQVAAPGAGIYSAYGGTNLYTTAQGTSFSTPIAGAVLGLVMAAHPALSPAEAIDRVVQGGDFDARLAGLVQSGRRVNLAGALAPFAPYSGLAYLDTTVPVSLYTDSISGLYGSISGVSLDPAFSTSPDAAVLVQGVSGAWAVSALRPGIAQFTLSFDGAAAPVGTYDTGPWRVTAIRPFTAQAQVGQTLAFTSLLPAMAASVSWSVTDTTVASISTAGDGTGQLLGLQPGMTRVVLSVDGEERDYSGWVLVTPQVTSSRGGGGCGTTAPSPEDPWAGPAGMVLTAFLLLVLRRRWSAAAPSTLNVRNKEGPGRPLTV